MIEYMRMKLIVGLGNPGAKFKNTRHNIGFMVVDRFAVGRGLSWRFSRDWICFFIKKEDCVVIKPSTFMNKSGHSVAAVANFFKIGNKDILVVQDDLDLLFSKIRISFDSTSAGHKGVESIIERLGSFEFGRLRIGIGKPAGVDGEKYVLENFSEDEQKQLEGVCARAVEAIDSYLESGISATMNRFN